MALTNWLTRDEWNACFFLGGLAEIPFNDLGEQLRIGIGRLIKAGYEFEGITADEDGNYEKVTQCCGGNASVLADMVTGAFDAKQRAEETIAWLESKPELKFEDDLKELKKCNQ